MASDRHHDRPVDDHDPAVLVPHLAGMVIEKREATRGGFSLLRKRMLLGRQPSSASQVPLITQSAPDPAKAVERKPSKQAVEASKERRGCPDCSHAALWGGSTPGLGRRGPAGCRAG